jgi:O-antigen ligase
MANRKNQKSKPVNQKAKPAVAGKGPINFRKATDSSDKSFQDKKALRWLLWGGALVTLVMWLSLNDPFNAPKSWVLTIAAFWLLGWLSFNFKFYIQNKVLKQASLISAIFLATLTIAFIATDNKFVGFFGQYGRKTGFIEYFAFLVFFLTAAYLIRLDHISKFERTVVFMGSLLGVYGFFQHYKIDFVKWHYLYNSVLGTLGNPDFAGAMMAILLVLNFGVAIESKNQLWFRSVAGFNVALLAIVIVFSQARQGLLAGGLGIAFIVLVWIYQRQKKVALGLTALSLMGGVTVIAGMLNVGPLTKYFYKLSVTYRGDYWRAAIHMFLHHPLFGVGLDRYGAYFRQYRDATQSLRRGPLTVADAAHDVPLQLAATGGIFVLLAFLLITGFTLWRGIVALRATQGSKQIFVAVIFGAWITYQAQSLISIDNIGIAIWGYILGGALIGISILPQADDPKKPEASQAQTVVSAGLALVLVVISFLFYQSESAFHILSGIVPSKNASVLKEYESFVNKPLSYLVKDPSFVLTAGQDYQAAGDNAKAISTLKGLVASDSHNSDAIAALANIYSSQKNYQAAIPLDKAFVKLDPFNQIALLQLGRDLKASGDAASAKAVIAQINAFAPNSPEAKQAQTEFGQ